MSEGHAKVSDNYANISDEFRRRHKVTTSFACGFADIPKASDEMFRQMFVRNISATLKSRKYELTPSNLNENMLDKFKRIKILF